MDHDERLRRPGLLIRGAAAVAATTSAGSRTVGYGDHDAHYKKLAVAVYDAGHRKRYIVVRIAAVFVDYRK